MGGDIWHITDESYRIRENYLIFARFMYVSNLIFKDF